MNIFRIRALWSVSKALHSINSIFFLVTFLLGNINLHNSELTMIQPHQDGPAYFPVVAILSLKSPVVIDFTPHPRLRECANKEESLGEDLTIQRKAEEAEHDERHDGLLNTPKDRISPCSLLLMPCSLFIFKDQAYAGITFIAAWHFFFKLPSLPFRSHTETLTSDWEKEKALKITFSLCECLFAFIVQITCMAYMILNFID